MKKSPKLRLVTNEDRAADQVLVDAVKRTACDLDALSALADELGFLLENCPESLPPWMVEYNEWCIAQYAKLHPKPAPWTVTFADGRVVIEGNAEALDEKVNVLPFKSVEDEGEDEDNEDYEWDFYQESVWG